MLHLSSVLITSICVDAVTCEHVTCLRRAVYRTINMLMKLGTVQEACSALSGVPVTPANSAVNVISVRIVGMRLSLRLE